jgi:hypothetical protein
MAYPTDESKESTIAGSESENSDNRATPKILAATRNSLERVHASLGVSGHMEMAIKRNKDEVLDAKLTKPTGAVSRAAW